MDLTLEDERRLKMDPRLGSSLLRIVLLLLMQFWAAAL